MEPKKIQLSRIINLLFRGLFSFAALISFVILFPVMAHALTPVTVAWDANNPAPDGYIIYWGATSGNLTNSHDAGGATQYTIPDLTEGVTYYFAATAYEDDNGVRNESAYSEELSHTIAPLNSNPTTPSVPSGPASGFIQTTYSFSANASDPDDDQLEYEFDWGDGVISGWGNSTQSHTWLSTGDYCVNVRARDVHGATSGWSGCGSIYIRLNTHTIAASAGAHGSISPSGSVTVNSGADQSFSINPDQYYRVANVVVDGSSVGSETTYTFDSVDRDHTIVASFVVDNQPPVSNAGADKSVWVSDTVQLDGSGSSDANGDSLTYNWSFVSKPSGSTATLSNTGIVNPTFEVDVAGTYTVQLMVNDGTVNSAPDTVTISTDNSAPVSNAGADQSVLVNDTVQLDGSGSSDVDGDSVISSWSLLSTPSGSSATLSNTGIVNPTFEVDVAGTYTVQLMVNDGTVNSAPDTVTISTENSAPVANAVPSGPATGFIQTDYSFSSTASDPDNDTLEYQYDWGDDVISGWGNSTQSHTWSNTGNYCVRAQARDAHGATSGWSSCGTINIGLNTHTIAASAGASGSINPSGSVVVNNGDPQTFSITAAQDYQILEVRVDDTLIGTASSYTFNNVTQDHTISASFVYVDPNPVDSDGDGVPDSQDAFPQDPTETTDTDGDGYGNNSDDDDDGDQMPDAWEIENDLDPLVNDATGDPDGDGATNFEEYEEGTGPNFYEDHFPPEAPAILTPLDNELVSMTPQLTTDEFYDPDTDDVHAETRWQIFRAEDNFCVLDVTSHSAFTSLKVPKLILEEDTDYIWQVRFINNHATESDWSAVGSFTTDLIDYDPNGNGIPDSQEVAGDLDLDNDGVLDSEQTDIKCVDSPAEDVQIGVSIKDSDNVASIVSMQIEDANEALPILESIGIPKFFQFGLIDFKILTHAPGDETVVTIHLSKAALDIGKLYKYDPINAEWMDYSDYAEFSADRKVVYLTLKDGGFGDADGIENGIIVDPLTVGTATALDDGSGSADSEVEDFLGRIIPSVGCFISTAVQPPAGGLNIWSEIRGRELAILFILILLAYVGKTVFDRKKI